MILLAESESEGPDAQADPGFRGSDVPEYKFSYDTAILCSVNSEIRRRRLNF